MTEDFFAKDSGRIFCDSPRDVTLYVPLSWQEPSTLTLAQKWKSAIGFKHNGEGQQSPFKVKKQPVSSQKQAQCMLQTQWLQSEPFETFFCKQIVFWMLRKCVSPGAAPYEQSTLYHKTCKETH